MSRPELLTLKAHRHTRVINTRGARYGDSVNMVAVVPRELRRLVTQYPVFMAKEENTGQFNLCALLGFEEAENLYLDDNGWQVEYVPLQILRDPFLIGVHGNPQSGEAESMLHINMDSKRVQETEGEALFLDDGAHSEYLQRISSILSEMVRGIEESKEFSDQLQEFELIEPVSVNATFANGKTGNVQGLYTIHHEKIRALKDDKLQKLHRKGYLELAHLQIASLENMQALIKRKNQRNSA